MTKIKVGDYVESFGGLKGQVVAINRKYVFVPTPKDSATRYFSDRIGFRITNIKIHRPFKCYEVLWFEGEVGAEEIFAEEFATRKEAMNFYKQHQNDEDKWGWMVTKRNLNWEIVEDIIY